jgi:uncharacterized cupredoxin-like copper-binding protein
MNRITTAAAVFLLLTGGPALAASNEVHVILSAHDAAHEMHIAIDRASVAAGPVTFVVENRSGTLEHEMIVARVAAHDARLPYDATTGEVPEAKIQALGEVPELNPGATGRITLDMKPGEYVLFCNVKAHYGSGMETPLTVR